MITFAIIIIIYYIINNINVVLLRAKLADRPQVTH